MQKRIEERATKRMVVITEIINKVIESKNYHVDVNPFQIDQNTKRKIIDNLTDTVKGWNVLNSKTNESPKQKLVKFWNHKKAQKLGTHLFNTIICDLFLV